jgi:hypothetical protein
MSRAGRLSSSASGHVYSTPTNVKMAMPRSAERRLHVRSKLGNALPIGSFVPAPASPTIPITKSEAAIVNVRKISTAANGLIPSRLMAAMKTMKIVAQSL